MQLCFWLKLTSSASGLKGVALNLYHAMSCIAISGELDEDADPAGSNPSLFYLPPQSFVGGEKEEKREVCMCSSSYVKLI